jgi:hypothetical protein
VLAGAQCANIPSLSYSFCNYVAEQMPPTQAWGEEFLTEPLATRTRGDTFRVLAAHAGTTVAIDGTIVDTLEAGQFYQTQLAGASMIVTSEPALVAQFSDSTNFDEVELADPSETLVSPTAQFLGSYTYATPPDARFTNYVNVIAPSSETNLLLLDGATIPGDDFAAIGSSGFSGAQIRVEEGTHMLSGPRPFGLTAYGFGIADAYSYWGGYAQSVGPEEVPTAHVTNVPTPTAAPIESAPTATPAPILGQRQTLQLIGGKVSVRLKGTTRFVLFSGTGSIPDGSEVEATQGRVLITVATRTPGQTQSAEVYGGRFLIRQDDRSSGETRLTLTLPLIGCPHVSLPRGSASGLAARVAHRSGRRSRRLWVSESGGNWGTDGRYVSATVEGTQWLTVDECNESRVTVVVGKVRVHDLVDDKTKILTTGQSYVAALR